MVVRGGEQIVLTLMRDACGGVSLNSTQLYINIYIVGSEQKLKAGEGAKP